MEKLMRLKNNDRKLIIYGNITMRDAGHGIETIDMGESECSIREIKDGMELPFEVKSIAWDGTEYDEKDILESKWNAFVRRNIVASPYESLEVHPVLQTAAN